MEDLLLFIRIFFRDVCRCWVCWLHIVIYITGNNMCLSFRRKMPGEGREPGIAERCLCLFDLYRVMWFDLTSQPVLFWSIHSLFSCDINKTCFRHEYPRYLSFFCKSAPVTPEWTQENCRTMTPNETMEASERALKRSDQVGRCEGDVMFMPSLQGFVG